MSTPTGDNPRVKKQTSSNQMESVPASSDVNAMSVHKTSGPLNTQGMANELRLDEINDTRQFEIQREHIKLDHRFRLIWTTFCVAAAAAFFMLLAVDLWAMTNSSLSSPNIERIEPSPASYTALLTLYALQVARERILLGFLFGALLSVVGAGVIFEGLYKSAGEYQRNITPELVRLRQREAMYRIVPGVVLVVCATILISFSLFSRLPGGPTIPPPVDDVQKQQGVNSGSNSRPNP